MGEIKMQKAVKASDLNLLDDFGNPEYQEWVEGVNKLLKGKPFDKAMLTNTYEGITLKPIYTQDDVKDLTTKNQLPGNDDYVRHNNPNGFVGTSWEIAQEQTAYSPVKVNRMLLKELKLGVTKVRVRLDRQSKIGKNPNKLAHNYYYRGTSVANKVDMDSLMKDIDLSAVAVDLDSGIMAPAYLALLNSQLNDDSVKLTGNVAFDPMLELEESAKLAYSLPHLYDLMRGMIKWNTKHNPEMRVISINTKVYSNSGASSIQELGYAFAKAVEYIREMLARELNIDDILKSIQFNLFIGSDFFMEVAKFRAARYVWSNIARAFGASEDNRRMYIHASSSEYNKTMYDPYVNILRTATEGFSAILGSVDSLHLGFFDELHRRPDEFSRRIARNQQIILNEEANLGRLIDPAGGSWYVEKLTSEIADKVWELFQEVESKGGMTTCLKSGLVQAEIEKVAAKRRKNLNTRKDVIIGTNMFANLTEEPLENRDNDIRRQVQARILEIEDIKSERAEGLLETIKSSVLDPKCSCTIDKLTELWNMGATITEISKLLFPTEDVMEIPAFNKHRAVEHFEKLRSEVEKMETRPEVFFANMGPIPQHKPRADFSRGFFEVGGFDIHFTDGFECQNCVVKAYKEKLSSVVVICSTDDTYPELVPAITAKVRELNPNVIVVVAGYPKEHIESFKKAGVDEFIHIKANTYEILKSIVEKVGGAE